ncbi:MAG: hypothetical protein U0X73_07720 [Thermoanaerobaculia bacterium]
MFKRIPLVSAVWHIIVGGWIIFWNGKGWCIACREDTILTVLGVVALVLGVVGLAGRFSSDPMPGRAA